MIYDGVLSNLLNIDLGQMEHALKKQLGKKLKAVELNMAALEAGAAYSARISPSVTLLDRADERDGGHDPRRGQCRRRLRVHDGGRDGLRLVPDHPSSSLPETLIQLLKKHRHDADGKATYAVIQAEDEIASIGMVVGAGWAGHAR